MISGVYITTINVSLENILTCNIIMKYHESIELSHENIKYEDIFSGNIHEQQRVTELYSQTRNNIIISGTPVANSSGAVHGALTVQNQCIFEFGNKN